MLKLFQLMKMNISTLKSVIEDIKNKTFDNRISNITLINSRDFLIAFTSYRKEKLLVCLEHQNPFISFCSPEESISTITGGLSDVLRKELKEAIVLGINLINEDRVVDFSLVKTNDFFEKETKHLILELIPFRSNLILTDDKYVAELTENVTLLAEFEERFEAEAYYLASQGNVVITYNGDYSKVYFAITPKFGYKVSSVMLNGVTIQFNGGVIEADNDKYNLLTVLFAELITIDNIQNGIIEYELNEISQTVTFKVTPADGYELEKFNVNGGEVTLTDNTYTTELTSDLFVSATFKSTASEEESEEEITPEKENKKTNPYLPITIVLISVGLSLAVAGGIILIIKRKKK